jgi:hypothetical protein
VTRQRRACETEAQRVPGALWSAARGRAGECARGASATAAARQRRNVRRARCCALTRGRAGARPGRERAVQCTQRGARFDAALRGNLPIARTTPSPARRRQRRSCSQRPGPTAPPSSALEGACLAGRSGRGCCLRALARARLKHAPSAPSARCSYKQA